MKKEEKTAEEKVVNENDLILELNNKIKSLEEKSLYKDAELINYRKRKDEEVDCWR